MSGVHDLSGRVAMVTGASSGLGQHFARTLSAAGAAVVLAARRTEPLQAVADEITRAGGRAVAVGMDVTDEGSTIAAYDAAEAAFGPVDTVIANAGVSPPGPVTELAMATFDEAIAVNLRGVFLTVREGARRMLEQASPDAERGRVVIIASLAADKVERGLAVYSATKAAVQQMGRVMARDWANRGINVNMICPGYIRTEMNAAWFATEAGRKHIAQFPRSRLLEPSDLDSALLYLCSDASRRVTGSSIAIDDGQSL